MGRTERMVIRSGGSTDGAAARTGQTERRVFSGRTERRKHRTLTCMPRDVALRVLAATSKPAHVFGASGRILLGWAGHFIATNPNSNGCLTGGRGRSGFWTGTADISPAVPFLSVRIGMPGVCSAGCVGGQATQPRSTHTPSPSVQLGGVGWSPHCHARGRR